MYHDDDEDDEDNDDDDGDDDDDADEEDNEDDDECGLFPSSSFSFLLLLLLLLLLLHPLFLPLFHYLDDNDNDKDNQRIVDTKQLAVINNDKKDDKKESNNDKKISGLDESNELHKLEADSTKISISSLKEYEESQPTCIICLDIFDEEDAIFSNINDLYTTKKCNCKYYVHKNCLNTWIYDNEKCLMCKDPFQTIELIQDKLGFYEELEKKYMTKIHGNIEEFHKDDYRNLLLDYHTLSGPFNLTNKKKTCCNNEECLDCMRHMLCLCITIITVTFFFIILLPY